MEGGKDGGEDALEDFEEGGEEMLEAGYDAHFVLLYVMEWEKGGIGVVPVDVGFSDRMGSCIE